MTFLGRPTVDDRRFSIGTPEEAATPRGRDHFHARIRARMAYRTAQISLAPTSTSSASSGLTSADLLPYALKSDLLDYVETSVLTQTLQEATP